MFSVRRPHRTRFSFEKDKIYAMKIACNLAPLCEVSFNLLVLDENTKVLKYGTFFDSPCTLKITCD